MTRARRFPPSDDERVSDPKPTSEAVGEEERTASRARPVENFADAAKADDVVVVPLALGCYDPKPV